MNGFFFSASIIAFAVGLIHTVLGEMLIFRKMRRNSFIPTNGGSVLRESNVRILWASWHALTVFGWGLALLLLWLARHSNHDGTYLLLVHIVAVSMLAGSALIFIGTKGKHPGWAGLLIVAILSWMGD
ncbi:hypothetical protein [Paenibacillus soyae]|uniref:Uncharacterized protein n=1 Tax=Paenibacillus soyae TaxID=2969249 RepID=A0A9X2MV25_9BACL|nr:hypothetical protein [Paenibacillus soyae]MCR2806852.1 hypothetical protein [Paenibacillus soyae]